MSFEQELEEWIKVFGPDNPNEIHAVCFNFAGNRYPFFTQFPNKDKADKFCRQMREWLNELLNQQNCEKS